MGLRGNMYNCDKCNCIIDNNEGDNYEQIHFICKNCFSDPETKTEWEEDKEHYEFADYGIE